MKLKIGISPCPNDTYIFAALANNLIPTEDLEFEFHYADVEELNKHAFDGKFDVIKMSFHASLFLTGEYRLLNHGAALGFGCGPLLVSKNYHSIYELHGKSIAVPGKYTTAKLLLNLLHPELSKTKEVLFSEIGSQIISGSCDAGVIIHESRFTYRQSGLNEICDLGKEWEETTNSAIPLGGIFASSKLPLDLIRKIDYLIGKSIDFADQNPDQIRDFIKCHAQETEEEVIKQHIKLYVNDETRGLSDIGQKSIKKMVEIAFERKIIKEKPDNIFLI